MEAWQGRLVRQIVDQVDAWTNGSLPTEQLLRNTEGLMDAADLRGKPGWDEFYLRWARIDREHELLTEDWAPVDSGSADPLRNAVQSLRQWAVDAVGRVTFGVAD